MGIAFLQVSTMDPEFLKAILSHYSGSSGPPPGQKLAWRIVEDGRHVGWIGLGEAPFCCTALRTGLGMATAPPPRDAVCCFIFRLEDRPARRAHASSILREWHPVAAIEWERRKGFPPVHWITFVDPGKVRTGGTNPGACFRRAGYRPVGMTTGKGRRRPSGSTHSSPSWVDSSRKLVLYRGPLHRLPGS